MEATQVRPIVGAVYRHYKGNRYYILGHAEKAFCDREGCSDPMVIYQSEELDLPETNRVVAVHSETLQLCLVCFHDDTTTWTYLPVKWDGFNKLPWVRPLDHFQAMVDVGGDRRSRFALVD